MLLAVRPQGKCRFFPQQETGLFPGYGPFSAPRTRLRRGLTDAAHTRNVPDVTAIDARLADALSGEVVSTVLDGIWDDFLREQESG